MTEEALSLFDTIMHRLDLVTQGKHPAKKGLLSVVKELQSILDESSLVAEERIHARTHLAAAFMTIDPNYDLSLLPLVGEFDLGATVSPETLKSLDAIEANLRHAAANASNVVVGEREPNRFDLLFRGKEDQEGLKSV